MDKTSGGSGGAGSGVGGLVVLFVGSDRIMALPSELDRLNELEHLLEHFEQVEGELASIRDGLTRAHRLTMLGTMASIIAHEVNNLLTPVISYAQLALQNPEDHALAQKALQRVVENAKKATSISESMLNFVRDGRVASAAGDAPLAGCVEQALQCMGGKGALNRDHIRLTLDLPQVSVAMPALHVQQVVMNLVLNARKAMKQQGGGVLTIRGRANGGRVYLAVADTGPGVPDAIRDRIFEPFVTMPPAAGEEPSATADHQQEHADANLVHEGAAGGDHVTNKVHATSASSAECEQSGRTDAQAGDGGGSGDAGVGNASRGSGAAGGQVGTGLGLCICKQLVEQAGGSIRVESEPGRGATFHVELPQGEGG